MLLEETSLARRPGLPMAQLEDRLSARLARHGVDTAPGRPRWSASTSPSTTARHRAAGVLGFGAAAPLMHPATGFSVAATLRLAPAVADALAAHLPGDPRGALAAAQAVLWPPAAQAVHLLRRRGLEALLRMPPEEVPAFFEVFFALPEHHRWAYLTGRDDLLATVAAMNALFGRAGWRLRRRLVGPALRPALRANAPAPTPVNLGQTRKPSARSCSRPSSVIFSGPHGGIQTQLILMSSTMPEPVRADARLVLDHVGQRAGRRRQRHVDRGDPVVHGDAVDQAEVDDVDPQLGVDDVAHRLLDVVERGRRPPTVRRGGSGIPAAPADDVLVGRSAERSAGRSCHAPSFSHTSGPTASLNAIQPSSAHFTRAG